MVTEWPRLERALKIFKFQSPCHGRASSTSPGCSEPSPAWSWTSQRSPGLGHQQGSVGLVYSPLLQVGVEANVLLPKLPVIPQTSQLCLESPNSGSTVLSFILSCSLLSLSPQRNGHRQPEQFEMGWDGFCSEIPIPPHTKVWDDCTPWRHHKAFWRQPGLHEMSFRALEESLSNKLPKGFTENRERQKDLLQNTQQGQISALQSQKILDVSREIPSSKNPTFF